jgi:hypothetical protein
MPLRIGQSDLANCAGGHVNSGVKPSAFANVGRLESPHNDPQILSAAAITYAACCKTHLRGKPWRGKSALAVPKLMLIKMPFSRVCLH